MDRDSRLGILASAILDGTPVDWPAVESTGDASDRAVVRQLQVLAEIAALHRHSGTPSVAKPSVALDETRPVVTWGHLRLLESVGRGSFGEVYRAWDTHLDREVALKLLRTAASTGDPSASIGDPARVVNEGRILARVRHPNVITVYGAEPREGRVGIWMEFIRGRTLHQIIEQQGPLGAREAAAVGIDLCHALAAVHRAGLLHRDVTARNVMREDGGRVVLMDFGTGHEYHDGSSGKSDVMGTPVYMAPELFVGGVADQRTDIYALGALLYFLATHNYPVTGRSLADIGEAHKEGRRARLRDVRPDLPAPFVKAVEQATAADPAQRYPTAGDLEAALDAAMRAAPTFAPAVPGIRPKRLLAAAAAVVAVAGVAWASVLWRGAPGRDEPGSPKRAAAAAAVTARKMSPPAGVWGLSNPSDDGRYAAATVNETGDVAIVDLASGQYRPLGIARSDGSDGYASNTALSPDGTSVAVDWRVGDKTALHVIRSDGSGHRVLIDSAADLGLYQWSRDGSLILAVVTGPDSMNTVSLVAAADGAVRPVHILSEGEFPELMTLSPDARYVAYDYPQTPLSRDRDVFILDTHTGQHWPLAAAPGNDTAPLWAPDGRAILFFSDRSRAFSAWMVPMANGRPAGEPRLMKDDVGRVWPRGFTRDGALHYMLWAGFAEVYVAAIDGTAPVSPEPISPREALSNFYPRWSPDGRFIAYRSERRGEGSRAELWVYDTTTQREERVATDQPLGLPFGWSPDGQRILTAGPNDARVFAVDRASGDTRLVAKSQSRAYWLPEGIVFATRKAVVLQDAVSGRQIRSIDFSNPGIAAFRNIGLDGRSAMALWKNGRVTAHDVVSGAGREWYDPGVTRLGFYAMAPHGSAVAYTGFGQDSIGDWISLKVSTGAGDPRELLRVRGSERLVLGGWTPDGLHLLVMRWTQSPPDDPAPTRLTTLWRVPVGGGAPISTGITMEALRDVSIHPDGRRIAFNVGFKIAENWVLENLLAK